jgi:hypothetical protein
LQERRKHPRLALEASAVVYLESATGIQSKVVNASERGVMLRLPDVRPVGTPIRITVHVADPPATIAIAGIIVHVTVLEILGAGPAMRAGIALTEAGPDWMELCRSLAAR